MKTLDPIAVVLRFNEALNARDVDAMMALLSPDSVFENTFPPPDGTRFEGHMAIRTFWETFFRGSTHAQIATEDIFALGERCVMRWRYEWVDANGQTGHIRGVDVYVVQGGLIAEKLSYVKG